MEELKGASIFLSASIDALLERILSQKNRESGVDTLTASQARILFLLWRKDEIPIQEVSRITHLRKSTLTSVLAKLEKAGHIALIPCQADKRKTLVKVINRNEELVSLNKQIIDEVAAIFYQNFAREEIELYDRFLRRTLDNLLAFQTKNKIENDNTDTKENKA